MAKRFKVNKGFILTKAFDSFLDGESYEEGSELLIREDNGKEFIFDGCFRLGESNDEDILKYGEVVGRVY